MKTENYTNSWFNIKQSARLFLLGGIASLVLCLTTVAQIDLTDDVVDGSARAYNIRIGELQLDLSAGLTATYDSNVNLREDEFKEEGTAITPQITTAAFWAITPNVTLNSSVRVAYRSYVSGDGEDGLFITDEQGGSDATIDFDFLLSDDSLFTIGNTLSADISTITQVVSRTNNETQNLEYNRYAYTLSGDYAQRLTPYTRLNLGGHYGLHWTTDDVFDFNDYTSTGFTGSIVTEINPDLTGGITVDYTTLDYDSQIRVIQRDIDGDGVIDGDPNSAETTVTQFARNDQDLLTIAGTFNYTTEAGATFQGRVGATNVEVDVANDLSATESGDWIPHLELSLNFSSGAFLTHILTASNAVTRSEAFVVNQADPDDFIFSNYAETQSLGYSLNYLLNEAINMSLGYSFTDSEESDGGIEYKANNFTAGAIYSNTDNSSIYVNLQYEDRFDSNFDGVDYQRFLVNGGFQYNF